MRDLSLGEECLHPAVLAIAVEIILYPKRRANYSPLVQVLADEVIGSLRRRLSREEPGEIAARPEIAEIKVIACKGI